MMTTMTTELPLSQFPICRLALLDLRTIDFARGSKEPQAAWNKYKNNPAN